MRKFALFLFSLVVSLSIHSQSTIEFDSYGLDQYIEKCTDIPVIRKINGGTVFKITYEPEDAWDNSMKGAFEYACKIWEEQLPNTLPINILVKIDFLRGSGSGKLLSRVLPTSYNYYNTHEELANRIKYVLLAEYNTRHNVTFVDSIKSEDFFNKIDITITYNKNMLNDFSFSLYSTPVDKYDFVTVALRDIAKGLGFISGFTADPSIGAFHNTNKPKTYYEYIIQKAIGTSNVYDAYHNSTQDSLSLCVPNYGNLNLHAPNVWKNGVSLNYFIPDSTKKITELLTYNFGRGSVIRDISDDYNTLFSYLHGWQTYNLLVGPDGTSARSEGTTENLLSYNGTITIQENSTTNINELNEYTNSNLLNEKMNSITNQEDYFHLGTFLFPYNYMYPDEEGIECWLVSILKKDGTWDLVYRQGLSFWERALKFNMADLNINSDHNQYQRTCDGYLRCRITYYKQEYDNLYHQIKYRIRNYYYIIDYLPQRVNMGFKTNNLIEAISYNTIDNDYSQMIKININGLEGVERIVVEQLDEGNELPIRFEVPDFKKGYFTAIVDKELYTKFVVYSYNKNGYTKSEQLTIAPLSPFQQLYYIQIRNNTIILSSLSGDDQVNSSTYVIYSNSSNNITPIKEGVIETANCSIDISDLKSGSYILTIQSGNKRQSAKFIKK